jgi:hypothetical protein
MGTEKGKRNRTELVFTGLQTDKGFVVLNKGSAEPIIDFNSRKLRKGERAPKGWRTVPITAAHLPPEWPENRPYACSCGCGITYRVGDRIAFRNLRVVGFGKPKWPKK